MQEASRFLVLGTKGLAFLFVCIISFTVLLAPYVLEIANVVQVVYINVEKPALHKVSQKFLSIGLDDIVIAEGFSNFNTTDKKLIKMMRYLSPGYLRVGGNLADKLLFVVNETGYVKSNFYKNYEQLVFAEAPNFAMTGSDWEKLCELSENAKLDIIFDLNSLIRFDNGSWDYRNAQEMLNYSSFHELKINWELGNEPNSYRHKFNQEVNPIQLGKDFRFLKQMLREYDLYKDSFLVGPDITRFRDESITDYFKEFLKSGGDVLNAITWHHYYLNGRTAQLDDFLDYVIFDTLKAHIDIAKETVKSCHLSDTPIWLGETSSAYGGGAPNLSDRFVGSFIWLDKLGLSAKMGIDIVVRQSIFHGNYALLDDNYDPNPDWWLSVIYKTIVGPEVVPCTITSLPQIRIYCHCTENRFADPSVTVFGMNLANISSSISIEGIKKRHLSNIHVYELSAEDSFYSRKVRLNGKTLKLGPNQSLPKFVPEIVDGRKSMLIQPLTLFFWIIPEVQVAACSL